MSEQEAVVAGATAQKPDDELQDFSDWIGSDEPEKPEDAPEDKFFDEGVGFNAEQEPEAPEEPKQEDDEAQKPELGTEPGQEPKPADDEAYGDYEPYVPLTDEQLGQLNTKSSRLMELARDRIVTEFTPAVASLKQQRDQTEAELRHITESCKDDSYEGGYRPPLPNEITRLNELQQRKADIDRAYKYLENVADQSGESIKQEIMLQHHMELDPRLKKYEKQFREIVSEGTWTKTSEEMVRLCLLRAPRRAAKKEASAPAPTDTQIKEQVMERSLERKRQAAIGAGSGGAQIATPQQSKNQPSWSKTPERLHGFFKELDRYGR